MQILKAHRVLKLLLTHDGPNPVNETRRGRSDCLIVYWRMGNAVLETVICVQVREKLAMGVGCTCLTVTSCRISDLSEVWYVVLEREMVLEQYWSQRVIG